MSTISTGTMARLAAVAAFTLLLAACSNATQTTSGSDYLKRYADQVGPETAAALDPAIREAAAFEPALAFPARIGVARIEDGRFTPIPPAEAAAWAGLAKRLGPEFGELMPVSPLVMVIAGATAGQHCRDHIYCLQQTVRDIRIAAARQHLDVVLIYEVFGNSRSKSNPLAVTKLALVGFFLAPTENIAADGFAQAVLIDVRNAYTYGYASVAAERAALALSTSVNKAENTVAVLRDAETAATLKLVDEVEAMARRLRIELAAKAAEKTGVSAP